jgi:hypothetical protein
VERAGSAFFYGTESVIEHLLYLALRTVLARSWNELITATAEPARMQASRLLDIVARNAATDFGREHGFSDIGSVDDFRRRAPVRAYEDFEPYITRALGGENGVLTAENPLMFGRTSGATGRPKFIPITPSFYEEFSKMQKMWQRKLIADHRAMLRGKILSVMSPEIDGYTECGIPYGAMSGHSYCQQYPLAQMRYAVPYEVVCLEDFETRYYLALRMAVEKNVTAIAAMNPSTILLLMKKLKAHAGELARDLRDGGISKRRDIPLRLRRRLEEGLRPNKKRAAEFERLAESEGPIRGADVWENLSIILTWQGGSVAFFLREFPKHFPGVPLRDMGLIATEGYFSIPLWSNTPNGLLAITGHFFEFFDVEPDGARSETALGCEELERGRQYYVVVTTSGGLYRYDICDIIEVVDFYNKTPVIVFKQKGGNTISITGEKVTEVQATEAMRAAASALEITVEGFTLTLRLADPPSYVLAVEATGRDDRLLAELLLRFERELRLRNLEYVAKRDSQRLGDPLLFLLKRGFFEERRRERVELGAPDGQYKIAHVAPDPGCLDGVAPEAEITMPVGAACDGGPRA